MEEYRVRLVRSFAKAPPTSESKYAWAAFKTQYAQLVGTVARAKEAVPKKNKETGKKGVQKQKPAQQAQKGTRGRGARKTTFRGRGTSTLSAPTASTLSALAAAAGEEFELFEGRDANIEIRGGGGERG